LLADSCLNATIRGKLPKAGARLSYPPPYSPDLNPIEQTFAKIKHWMRTAQARTVADTWRHIGAFVQSINAAQ
jgi:transposase